MTSENKVGGRLLDEDGVDEIEDADDKNKSHEIAKNAGAGKISFQGEHLFHDELLAITLITWLSVAIATNNF